MTRSKVLLLVFCLVCTTSQMLNEENIAWITRVYYMVCQESPRCDGYLEELLPELVSLPENIPYFNVSLLERQRVCCGTCSCNISICVENDNCCPDILLQLQFTDGKGLLEQTRKECILPQLKPLDTRYPNSLAAVKMIASCYSNMEYEFNRGNNLSDTDRCVNRDMYTDFYTKIPVSDRSTGISYTNRYCAYCNGLSDENFIFWNPFIHCSEGMFYPEKVETLVEQLMLVNDCNLITNPPDGLEQTSCDISKINSCNETGRWLTYDRVLDSACTSFTAVFQKTYKNVFCFFCNENEITFKSVDCDMSQINWISFSILLKIEPDEEKKGPNDNKHGLCNMEQILDPIQGRCVNIKCMNPKALVGESCKNIVEKINGIGFDVFLKLTPIQKVPGRLFKDVMENIYNFVQSILLEEKFVFYEITMFYKDGPTHGRKEFSETHTVYIVVYLTFYLLRVGLTNILFIDTLLGLHQTRLEVPFQSNTEPFTVFAELDIFEKQNVRNNELSYIDTLALLDYHTNTTLTYYPMNQSLDLDLILSPKDVLLPIYNCPLVALNSLFYHVDHYWWGIYIQELDTNFSKSDFVIEHPLSIERNISSLNVYNILLCVERVKPIFKAFEHEQAVKSMAMFYRVGYTGSVTEILALISFCISVCCSVWHAV